MLQGEGQKKTLPKADVMLSKCFVQQHVCNIFIVSGSVSVAHVVPGVPGVTGVVSGGPGVTGVIKGIVPYLPPRKGM
jgi:hypothetical protein